MNCTACKNKVCRDNEQCAVVNFDTNEVIEAYQKEQKIVQAASELVDHGRAGTLSRLQEMIEFSKLMNYNTIGLAYCYGMENDAKSVVQLLKLEGFKVEASSCTVGGISQNMVNVKSNICNVSCNPIGQARQLNSSSPDLTITMGLCLGHDILFNREIKSDTTPLLVKDRVNNHNPVRAIEKLKN